MGSSFTEGGNNRSSCPDGGNIFPVAVSVFLLFVGRGASNACFSATYVATPELYVNATHRRMRSLLNLAATSSSYHNPFNH